MNTATLPQNAISQPRVAIKAQKKSGSRLGFALVILVNVLLLVRPGELFPSLSSLRLYEATMFVCLLIYWPAIFSQLSWRNLRNNPITVCTILALPITTFSTLWAGRNELLGEYALEYLKMVLYYLILICALSTPQRIKQFMIALCLIITSVGALALASHYEIIHLETIKTLTDSAVDAEGKDYKFERLMGIGIFGDPNDLAQILGVGMILCVYGFERMRTWTTRLFWAAPIGILAMGIYLTKSRGGLLAMMAGLGMLFVGRFGIKKALIVGALVMPLLLVAFGGRQTKISTNEVSAQSRVQLWSDALAAFRDYPAFGVSPGVFNELAGQVAHNSVLQAFAEIGFAGGMLFVMSYLVAMWGIYRLRLGGARIADPDLAALTPVLLSAIVCYFVGMLSLTRNYVIPTYTMLGLASAYLAIVRTDPPKPPLRWGMGLLGKGFAVSVGYLLLMQVFVQLFVRWG